MNTFLKDLRTSIAGKKPELAKQAATQIKVVARLQPDSFKALADVLQDSTFSLKLRAAACWLLAQAHYGRASTALWKAFNGNDEVLMWEAAKAFGILKTKSVFPKLISALKSKSIEHRTAAVYALGMMREPRAVTHLEAMVANTKESPTVRGYAVEALAYLKKRRSFNVLIAALNDPEPEVRWWAAFALGELGDKRALPELKRVASVDKGRAQDGSSVRSEARRAYNRLSERA